MHWLGMLIGLLCWLGITPTTWANALENIRVWPAPDETRIVIDMTNQPKFSYFTLTKPNRLIIDLKDTASKIKLPMEVQNSAILNRVRKSNPPIQSTLRLVFELKEQIQPRAFMLKPAGAYGYRLVFDLPNKLLENIIKRNKPKIIKAQIALPFGTDDILIAIDPGHGGNDPGAVGPRHTYEKYVTLSISRLLANKINAVPGMKAVMTRNGDYFLDLHKRSEIARKHGAHLLISVHADGFHKPQPRGASVWVLSRRRANSEIGRWLEKHEEQSNLLGGGALLDNTSDEYLSRAVLNLQFSNSQKVGHDVAVQILKEMGHVTKLHKSSPGHASLAVLKSPDIPSLLVEAGFITNPQEETLLMHLNHQQKIANAVFNGVLTYFEDFPPVGTLMAVSKNWIKHKVASGQSLFVIAKKYNSSISIIKTANGLKSNLLNLGQILMVPDINVRTPASTLSSETFSKKKPKFIFSAPSKMLMLVHKVTRGEYLGKIAANYCVTVSSIRSVNRLRTDELTIGQKLQIVRRRHKGTNHQVKRGEYLGKIASNYGVTVKSIRKINSLCSDKLVIGQKLIIPES
ncbi:N-acetylmuramoyl-L-alanine amidase [Candidatus Enterovibrio altilux]|uniref:N-acetylmuramoyl-L-alanine amidase n=1 Tax=Candidatus Enterovibrio altilux TaxID=1927128 RepID=A0A291B902_9GAMM|nr:N-acetylmuramoyl-L-alanine amidase [Candidatus Enterovibrio luxaltus]ATF09457.1 N-acetylmuramoyl-L-alanine amidase [Candidatus Enterovibrio luxaltus]